MENLIIDRKTWLRGNSSYSYLLRKEDKLQCCLGFYCLAKDLSKRTITNITDPYYLSIRSKYKVKPLLTEKGTNNQICRKLINTNDNEKISEKVREKRITKWFSKIGVKVKFIN